YNKGLPGWNSYLAYGTYWLFVALFIIPFCFLFYKLIEQPWIRLGDRHLKKKAEAKVEVQAEEKAAP
ncbi:MAG: hypothetical protein JOZ18_11985, partial [Chloroflexi bacterium]|nr:hypothetical protein [Chloroflexota bacterium]